MSPKEERYLSKANIQLRAVRIRIKEAIQILGRPVMDYAPNVAIGEYDKKIAEAVTKLMEREERL
jgi:hypothetical protein